MKVGLYVTNQQHLEKDMVQALDEQIAMVHAARDGGWDSLFSGQHYLNEGNNKQLQLVPFLARLIPEAGDMVPGLGVLLLNLHNPVYVAETVASLDIISRGRLVFGVGLGYRQVEFDAFDVPPGTRVARFEEYLDLVQRLWTEDRVTHHSETCRLDDVHMTVRPQQRPRPPIWIAADGDKAVERAARLGDTWFINPHATLSTIRRQLGLYRSTREAHSLPFPDELPVMKEIFCARDRETALAMAGPYLLGKYQDYSRWGQDAALPDDESFDEDLEELMGGRFVLGSPDECWEQLRPYWEELGVNHLILRSHWAGMPIESAIHSVEMITRHLLPELRRLS